MTALEWHVLFRAFAEFAALARQYHFYDEEVARMEQSMLDMDPYKRKEDAK